MKSSKVFNASPEMEALLAQYGMPATPRRGSLISGTVVLIDAKGVAFVSYGGKSDAIVADKDLASGELTVGQVAQFYVLEATDADESIALSYRRAKSWNDMTTARDDKSKITVEVTKIAKNGSGGIAGVNVRANGLSGFIPFSRLGVRGRAIEGLVEQGSILAQPIEVDPDNRRLIFDHAVVVAEIAEENRLKREALFDTLKKDSVLKGRVARFATKPVGADKTETIEFGMFVDIGDGLHGLVHRTEIPGNPARVSTVFNIGDEVTVKVLKCERVGERAQVSLSVKQAKQDGFVTGLQVGAVVTGRIARPVAFGFFVALSEEHGVDGLLHKSQLSSALREGRKELAVGDVVQVKVIDLQQGRIGLSMRGVPQDRPVSKDDNAPEAAVTEEVPPVSTL